MTTTTQTLADFLLARIAEDEARATVSLEEIGKTAYVLDPESGWWFPGRVLAECEAKRRIVEAVRRQVEDDDPYIPLPLETLRALASVYADHAEFREEWAL